jgi:hypothetical protein
MPDPDLGRSSMASSRREASVLCRSFRALAWVVWRDACAVALASERVVALVLDRVVAWVATVLCQTLGRIASVHDSVVRACRSWG